MTTPFGTVNEADTYFQGRIENDVWLNCDPDRKLRALISATRLINRLNFIGDKADPNQENEFPRGTSLTIPFEIKYATFESAYALADDYDPELEQHILVQDQMTYDQVRSKRNAMVLEHIAHGIPSGVAWSYLRPFLRDGSTFNLFRSL